MYACFGEFTSTLQISAGLGNTIQSLHKHGNDEEKRTLTRTDKSFASIKNSLSNLIFNLHDMLVIFKCFL